MKHACMVPAIAEHCGSTVSTDRRTNKDLTAGHGPNTTEQPRDRDTLVHVQIEAFRRPLSPFAA